MKRTLLSGFLSIFAASLLLINTAGCVKSGAAPRAGMDAYRNKDYATALAEFRKAAEEGNREAQYFLSVMYMKGMATAKDDSEAERWARKSAQQGYALAQVDLGMRRYSSKDYTNAMEWFQKAADQKDEVGLFFMGLMYARGTGVKEDKSEALRFFKLAKERGFPVPKDMLK